MRSSTLDAGNRPSAGNQPGRLIANQRGLTLLEILISMVILSMITMAIISTTDSSFESSQAIAKEDRDRLQLQTVFSIYEWDFSQIYSPLYFSEKFDIGSLRRPYSNPEPQDVKTAREELARMYDDRYQNNIRFFLPDTNSLPIPRFQVLDSGSTLEIMTSSHRRVYEDAKESIYAWVIYRLENPSQRDIEYQKEQEGKDDVDPGQNLVRYVYYQNPYTTEEFDTEKMKGQVLMGKIDDIQYEFWSPNDRDFTRLEQVPDGMGIIHGVRITLKYRDLYDQKYEVQKTFRPLWPKRAPESQNGIAGQPQRPGGGQTGSPAGSGGGQ